jgi:serine/threonine-protein kinase
VFEKKFIEVSKPASQPVSGPTSTNVATALAASRFPMAVLDKAEQRLAEYIGAVARVMVKRAAMKARDEAELYLLLSDEIEDKEEKKAFIRRAASISRAGGAKP